MATLVYMALCQHAVIDRQSNLASLFDLIEEVQIEQALLDRSQNEKLAVGFNMDLMALISREWPQLTESEDLKVSLSLVFPSGEIERLTEAKPDLSARRSRVIFKLLALPLRGAGLYEFQLASGEQILGRIPLQVLAAPVKEQQHSSPH